MAGPATFRVWIAFGTELFDDTALASDGNWTDVTDDIRSSTRLRTQVRTSTRRSQFDTFSAGQGTFRLDNQNGTYDPGYTSGTHYGDFKKHTPIRVTAEHSSTRYTVWFGAVRRWDPDYIGKFDGWTTVHAIDMLGVIAAYDLSEKVSLRFGGDSTSDRVDRALNDVGFPSAWRSLGNGGNTSTHSDTIWGINALRHIVDVSTADGGMVYADRDGTITQDSRNAPGVVSRQTTSQVTLDAAGGTDYNTVAFSGIGDDYRDLVRVSASVGDVQEIDNSATNAAPVVMQKLRTTLESESQALAVAQFYADLYSKDRMFPREVTFTPATINTDLRTALLTRQVRDRVTIDFDPPGPRSEFSSQCFIDGISHEIEGGVWRTTWQLSSADQYDDLDGAGEWAVVGTAQVGSSSNARVGY